MKLLLSVFVLCIVSSRMVEGVVPMKLPPEQLAKVHEYAMECIKQEKTTKEAVEVFSKGVFTGADKNLKCYTNCLLTKIGVVVDGTLQPAVVQEKLGASVGADKLKAIMDKCSSLKGSDNCETAYLLFECYHKEHADMA